MLFRWLTLGVTGGAIGFVGGHVFGYYGLLITIPVSGVLGYYAAKTGWV